MLKLPIESTLSGGRGCFKNILPRLLGMKGISSKRKVEVKLDRFGSEFLVGGGGGGVAWFSSTKFLT